MNKEVREVIKDRINRIESKDDLELVREDPVNIKLIQDPSEQVQLEAVRKYGRAIKDIP